MKKILNKIKNNIFISDLIFIVINVLINYILYLLNIRFRFWVIIFIILVSIAGFIGGIYQLLYMSSDNKKKFVKFSILGAIPIILYLFCLMPIIEIIAIFIYSPEHTTILDNKKYVAVINSVMSVDVSYYDYYGFLLMGTKEKVHGDFGKGNYDPFNNPQIPDSVQYTYYDNDGNIKYERTEIFVKEKTENTIDKNNYDTNINDYNNSNVSDKNLLPENEEILYEKNFGKTILRFGKVDNVLGKNMLVNVLKSEDNGKNFYIISNSEIQVSNEAKFIFLNENLGFVINNNKIYLNNNKINLYVTNDGGKTFLSSKFNYKNKNAEYINVKEVPYYEKNKLKIKCSVYQINSNKSKYENKELILISNDNGLTWNL